LISIAKQTRGIAFCLTILLLIFGSCGSSLAQSDLASKKVLILHSFAYAQPAYKIIDASLQEAFVASGLDFNNLYFEFLDLARNPGPEYRHEMAEIFRQKFKGRKLDLVLALHQEALQFLLKEGRDVYPEGPIISILGDVTFSEYSDPKRPLIHLPFTVDIISTVKAIFSLQPDTRKIVVIAGSSALDRRFEDVVMTKLTAWKPDLDVESIPPLPLAEILKKVANLPAGTAILYTTVYADSTGKTYMPTDAARMICATANAPVFGLFETLLGDNGIVGGIILDHRVEGQRAVRIAMDILQGNLPTEPITILPAPLTPMFDWQQLKRWGFEGAALPKDSIVLNKPVSVWDEYKFIIVGTLIFIFLESALLIFLFIQRHHKNIAEKSLKNAEIKYRDIFEGALEGIFETSPEGRLLTANAALAGMLGYNSPDEVTSTIRDLATQVWVNPDERAQYIRLLDKQGVILNYECQLRRKDGKVIWVSMNTRRVCGPDGRTLYFSGFLVDITEGKQTEKALAESQAQMLALFDSTNDMIWSVDPETFGLVTFNRALKDYFFDRLGVEIVVGMTPDQMLKPKYAVQWREFYQRALRDGSFVTEYPVVAGALLLSINPLKRNGDVFGISVFGKDITERKRAEEAIRESEAKYRSLYESMMDGYVLTGMDGRILKYNESYREMTGYSSEELLELTYNEITPEKWHAVEKEIVEKQILPRGYSEVYEKEYRKKDGTIFPVELRTFLHKGETGGNIGIWAIVRDITSRKQMESEARKLREDLAHVTRVSTLGELTSSLAHEINQPLAAILSNAQAAQRFLSQDKPDTKEIAEILGDIIRDDNRAAEVIRKIRSLLKKEDTRYESLSLNDITEEILNVIRNDTVLADLSIEKEFDPSLPAIWGDRIQLQQVILNLVLNAAEAMGDTGPEHRRLTVRTLRQDSHFAEVSIRDFGSGIEKNNASRLFEPFYTTKAGGIGMGLAISKDIIKSHKGEIRAENNPDRGATVSFTVPFDREVRP